MLSLFYFFTFFFLNFHNQPPLSEQSNMKHFHYSASIKKKVFGTFGAERTQADTKSSRSTKKSTAKFLPLANTFPPLQNSNKSHCSEKKKKKNHTFQFMEHSICFCGLLEGQLNYRSAQWRMRRCEGLLLEKLLTGNRSFC